MSEHNRVIKLKCGFRGQILTLQEISKIPQIGPKSANRLIIAGFDSLKGIALASPEEISEVLTIPKISANRIIINAAKLDKLTNNIPGLRLTNANRLLVAGFDSLEILAASAPNDIATITGISKEIAEKIVLCAKQETSVVDWEMIMPENKEEICRIVHPDDFQFFDNLEEFLRSNELTFEMRISCIGTDEIKLHSNDLDGELISDLMEFLRKTGESPKIIHFPIQDDIWITYDSWNQVHKIILDFIKIKNKSHQIREWYGNHGI